MSDSEIPLDPELTQDQMDLVSKLSDSDIKEIDSILLAQAGSREKLL